MRGEGLNGISVEIYSRFRVVSETEKPHAHQIQKYTPCRAGSCGRCALLPASGTGCGGGQSAPLAPLQPSSSPLPVLLLSLWVSQSSSFTFPALEPAEEHTSLATNPAVAWLHSRRRSAWWAPSRRGSMPTPLGWARACMHTDLGLGSAKSGFEPQEKFAVRVRPGTRAWHRI